MKSENTLGLVLNIQVWTCILCKYRKKQCIYILVTSELHTFDRNTTNLFSHLLFKPHNPRNKDSERKENRCTATSVTKHTRTHTKTTNKPYLEREDLSWSKHKGTQMQPLKVKNVNTQSTLCCSTIMAHLQKGARGDYCDWHYLKKTYSFIICLNQRKVSIWMCWEI